MIENEKIEKDKETQTIILTVNDVNSIYEKIKDIDIVSKVTIKDDKIYMYINKNNTSRLMSILVEKHVEYENVGGVCDGDSYGGDSDLDCAEFPDELEEMTDRQLLIAIYNAVVGD